MISEKCLHKSAVDVISNLLGTLRYVCNNYRVGNITYDFCLHNYNLTVAFINAYHDLGLINDFVFKVALDKAFNLLYAD